MTFARPVQTIEKTGKTYKAWQLIGWGMIGLGLIGVWLPEQDTAGLPLAILLLPGIPILVFAKVSAWWHHG